MFSLSLREFVVLVVCWNRSDRAQDIIAGQLLTHTRIINEVAGSLEDES